MSWERGGWEVGAEGLGRCKTESSKNPLSRGARRAALAPHRLGCPFSPLPSAPLPPLPPIASTRKTRTRSRWAVCR